RVSVVAGGSAATVARLPAFLDRRILRATGSACPAAAQAGRGSRCIERRGASCPERGAKGGSVRRLLAYIGNDPERVRCALHAGRRELVVDPRGADGWGVGFFHSGEVLLQRRPKPPEAPVDFYEVAGELKTDVLIGHVRSMATEAAP